MDYSNYQGLSVCQIILTSFLAMEREARRDRGLDKTMRKTEGAW